MPTIEEYRAKKLLTDKLRAQQAAYGAGDFDPMNVTRGSMGGTYQMPDIYQANLAGPLAKVAGSWLGGRVGEKADASEAEAEQLKQAALDEIMGAGGTMTPQQAIKLQELGIKVDPADFMTKPKAPPAAGAVLQAIQAGVPAALAHKVAAGDATPEEYAQVEAAMAARSSEEYKKEAALKQLGIKPAAAPKPLTVAQQRGAIAARLSSAGTPQEKEAIKQQLKEFDAAAGTTPQMSATEMKGYDKASLELDSLDSTVDRMTQLSSVVGSSSLQEPWQQIGNIMGEAARAIPQSKTSAFLGTVADTLRNADSKRIQSLTLDQVLKDMAKLGGSDSNEELRTILQRYPNALMDPTEAGKLAKDLTTWASIEAEAKRLEVEDRGNRSYYSSPEKEGYYKRARTKLFGEEVPLASAPAGTPAPAGATSSAPLTKSAADAGITQAEWDLASPEERAAFP